MGKPEFIITSETGKRIIDWCNSGVNEVELLKSKIKDCKNEVELNSLYNSNKNIINNDLIELFKKQKESWKQQA
jgi:hypothetical protein